MKKQKKTANKKKVVAKKPAAKKQQPKKTTKPAPSKPAKVEKKAEVETMERSALKAVASQLKDMGSDIKVLKSDSDEALQKKVNEALQKLPTGDLLKKLETIVPDKLVNVLKRDCIGIFIDLSDVSCNRCKDNAQCAKLFITNLKGGLVEVDKALPDAEKAAVKPVAKLVPVTRFKSTRAVFVRDVPNPNPPDHPFHDTIARILDKQPDTLEQLRAILEEDFEIESDGDFMKTVTDLRDPAEGVIKLVEDLTDKDKKALVDAGYEL